MKGLDIAAGIVMIISGTMTLAFGLFSVMGTGVGALMASGVSPNSEDQAMGFILVIAYGVFMVVGLSVGSVQLLGGVRLLTGNKDWITWVATIGSLLTVITVYCAPFGVVAFVLGLLALVLPDDLGSKKKKKGFELATEKGEAKGPGDAFAPPDE